MTTTVEELEKRVALLEQEMKTLRQRSEHPLEETPAERGARLIREGKEGHAQLVAGWNKAMEQMGIRGEPIGAEKLQEMMRASGIKPEDNLFSRGIIEMREE